MTTLKTNTGLFDISSLIQVQQYTMLEDKVIQIRVDLGDDDNPIGADGLYQIQYNITGKERDDWVDITAGATKTLIQSEELSVFAGEVITVFIKGVAADTNVRVTSYILDVTVTSTPVTTIAGGALGNSVWTEKEKNKIMKDVVLIKKGVKKMLGIPDNSEDIQEVKKQVKKLFETKNLTNMENKVNLLYKSVEINQKEVSDEILDVRKRIVEALSKVSINIDEDKIVNRIIESMTTEKIETSESDAEKIEAIFNDKPEAIKQDFGNIPEAI